MITRIRVPSTYQCVVGSTEADDAITFAGTADFALGIGPCGKTVEVLEVNFHAYGVEIVQVCTCTERKVFVYPWNTITGRIEVTHG